ncbi:MAG: protein BatD [Bdellovibrionales bacterium]|nr:protein BatD [Bdellovibrionales bacterium]
MRKSLLVSLFFGMSVAHAASRPVLQVSADPERSANGEPIHFKVFVKYEGNAPIRPPRMPVLSEWQVLNNFAADSHQTNVINGIYSLVHRYEYSWILKPLRTGTLVIPSMEVWIGTGTGYKTEEVKVIVDRLAAGNGSNSPPPMARPQPGQVPSDDEDPIDNLEEEILRRFAQGMRGQPPTIPPPTQQPGLPRPLPVPKNFTPPNEPVFVRAEPSSTRVYQGELITLSYSLYERAPSTTNHEFAKFPDFKGFLKDELFMAKQLTRTPTEVGGRTLLRSELFRYALFPLKSGELKIDPFTLKADYYYNPAQEDLMNNPMFQMLPHNMGGMQAMPLRKSSLPLVITSLPLPPAPADAVFTGGVGQFDMKWEGPAGDLHVDQPFTVMLTISGTGNVKAITEPALTLPKGLEASQTKPSSELRPDATGYKSFEFLILPREAGKYTLNPLRWTYFDPKKAQYITLQTTPLELTVGASTAGTPASAAGAPAAPIVAKWAPVEMGPQQFVRTSEIGQSRRGPLTSFAAWAFQGVLYVVGTVVLLRRRQLQNEEALYRNSPWEKTRRQIFAKDGWRKDELAILLDQWTRERLAGWLQIQTIHSESAREEILAALRERLHVEYHREIEPLRKLWSELDILRFTGGSSTELTKPKPFFERAEKTCMALLSKASRPAEESAADSE